MIFYELTSAGPRGRCWNPSLKGQCFNTSRGAQQMFMYQRKTCLIAIIAQNVVLFCFVFFVLFFLFRSKTLQKLLQKVLFICIYSGAKKHVTCERFENAASRAKTNIIATEHFTADDVNFYDGPGILIHKTAKPCINSPWIALLIHSFVPVKTWLLIACDTAFYAIFKEWISFFWGSSKCKLQWVACKMNKPIRDSCKVIGTQCNLHFDKHQKNFHCLYLHSFPSKRWRKIWYKR